MELHTNSSNNTIYADADGTIAYFHSNFIPRRNAKFDWTKPVDGSDPATEWNGVHSIDETHAASGADYLIAGTVFPSESKHGSHALLGISGLTAIVRASAPRGTSARLVREITDTAER